MLKKPPEPILGSIDGDRYHSLADYRVNFSKWVDGVEFDIYASTVTDIASVPWFMRWLYDRASLGFTACFVHDFLMAVRGKFTDIHGEEIQLSWWDCHLIFLVAMRLDGIPPVRAHLAYLAVLLGNRPIF
jgi:hypothetical protein